MRSKPVCRCFVRIWENRLSREWLGTAIFPAATGVSFSRRDQLMDADVKATGLKQLQGLIWKDGFQSGELVAHLFDDVARRSSNGTKRDCDVRIYSSGSIKAQQLFFGHTIAGDLLDLF